MEPVYSAGVLLVIAAVAVAVLLFLIIRLKMHAFVALVLVSLLTAIAAGIPLADVAEVAISFFGTTLGSVALLVGLGAMTGRLLEVTGGAQVLADTLINRFGEKRASFALGVAALLFSLPIFFDAGLVVFLPIIFSVARRFGGSVLLYALPAAGAFAAMHAIVPPHPGPVTAATELGGSIGLYHACRASRRRCCRGMSVSICSPSNTPARSWCRSTTPCCVGICPASHRISTTAPRTHAPRTS